MKIITLLLALALTQSSTNNHLLCLGIVPPNNLKIPKNVKSGLTQDEFNAILKEADDIFGPIVSSEGGRLIINKLWDSPEVNAFAHRSGSNYYVDIHGGLARHSAVTKDALALVVCHEIAHHIGGAPKSTEQESWVSIEGQSDYYASLKCLRILWDEKDNKLSNPDPIAVNECGVSFNSAEDQNLCVRATMAGLSAASMFASISNSNLPSLNRKDSSRVSKTYEMHPASQCRLDTYFAASICSVGKEVEVNNNDPNQGSCSQENGDAVGTRPLCWFKPGNIGAVAKTPTLNGQTELVIPSMSEQVRIYIDVTDYAQAGGVYLEFSRPNTPFTNPNGVSPDPQALGGWRLKGKEGYYTFSPSQFLPGFAKYEIRVFPLNFSGTAVIGKASDASLLAIEPNQWSPNFWWLYR